MDEDYRDNNVAHEDFRQRTNALGLADRITYVGSKRNDMREWLSATNIVMALANEPESIGINALQAIHLGTPVIGWDQAAFSEILQPLYPQGLVKNYNAKSLCKAVRNQLESVTRPEMTNQFTMREMIEETLGVYQNLHDMALAEEQAAIDAIAIRRTRKTLKKSAKPIREISDKNSESVIPSLETADKNAKVQLIKRTPKITDISKPLAASKTIPDNNTLQT